MMKKANDCIEPTVTQLIVIYTVCEKQHKGTETCEWLKYTCLLLSALLPVKKSEVISVESLCENYLSFQ